MIILILTNQYKKFLNLLVQLWKLTGKETHSGVEHDAQIELILWYILSFGGDVFRVAHFPNLAFVCVCCKFRFDGKYEASHKCMV